MILHKQRDAVTAQRLFVVLLVLCVSLWIYRTHTGKAKDRVLSMIFKEEVQSSAFDQFFADDKTVKFMADYKRNCRGGRFVFAGHLGTTNHDRVGYGSSLNTQANYFVVVEQDANRMRYQFRFVIHNWVYEPLDTFFDDFARDTPCPLFQTLNSTQFEPLRKNESFVLIYNNGSLEVSIDGPVLSLHPLDPPSIYWDRKRELEKLYKHLGREHFFSKKSALMRALWQPNPKLRMYIGTLWRDILDYKQHFFGLHIRRGSKLNVGIVGIKEVPLLSFAKKVGEICGRLGPECPKNVYVMHDEQAVLPVLQRMLNGTFQVYNFSTLLLHSNVSWEEETVGGSAHDPGWLMGVPLGSLGGWRGRTKQLIIELSLLALSNELICTYSSNICTLLALLRGNHTSHIYSMDQPEWDPW